MMKKQSNPILNGVKARVRQLFERYTESEVIQHGPTKGSLREAYLKQFLADFVPLPFALTSGFVTDSRGEDISPQIDLLAFDKTSIPGFALSEFATILPVESVRLAIEVKSMLKASDLSQIKCQQDAMRRLKIVMTTHDRTYCGAIQCVGIPQIVAAFDSECSQNTLLEWFSTEASIRAICVFKKWFLLRDPKTGEIETILSDDQHREVLHLASIVYSTVIHTQRELSERQSRDVNGESLHFAPDLGAYLTFDIPKP